MFTRAIGVLFVSVALCACTGGKEDPRLNNSWPCGVVEISLSNDGNSLAVTRAKSQAVSSSFDLTHALGVVADIGRSADLERRTLDLKGSELAGAKGEWKLQSEVKTAASSCRFAYALPEGSQNLAACYTVGDEIHVGSGDDASPAARKWSPAAISQIQRPIVFFGRTGNVLLVVEHGPEGQPIAIYQHPGLRIALSDPDVLTKLLPSEDTEGRFGFWTDTPFQPNDAQWTFYRFNDTGHPIEVRKSSEFLRGITFRRQAGRNYDLLIPEPQLEIAEAGEAGDDPQRIRYRKDLVRKSGNVTAWLETDNDQTSRVMVRKGQAAPAAVAVCPKQYPQKLYAVPLKGRFGPFRGILAQFDNHEAAPLAIDLHGGPRGDRSNPAAATFGIESNSDVLIRTAGFQKLSLDYPGSGVPGRQFRKALDYHAQEVGQDSLAVALAWVHGQDQQARPVIFGSSYGAYLAATTIPVQSTASSYVLMSGIYDPATEFRRRPGGERATPPHYFQGSRIFDATPTRSVRDKTSPLIIVTFGTEDRRVYPQNSEAFSERIRALGYNPLTLEYQGGTHDSVPFLMMDDARVRTVLRDTAKSSGSFQIKSGPAAP